MSQKSWSCREQKWTKQKGRYLMAKGRCKKIKRNRSYERQILQISCGSWWCSLSRERKELLNVWSWSRAPCKQEKEEQTAKLCSVERKYNTRGPSWWEPSKGFGQRNDRERKEITKQCKQHRGARLPLSLSAARAWFHLVLRCSSYQAGQQFPVNDLVTVQDSHALGLPLCVIKSYWQPFHPAWPQDSIINLISNQSVLTKVFSPV